MFFKRKNYEERFLNKAKKFHPFELGRYLPINEYLETHCEKIEARKLNIKLVIISDTHGDIAFHPKDFAKFIDGVPKFDLCVILGDVTKYDLEVISQHISNEKIIGVQGNHDTTDLLWKYHIRNLDGAEYIYNNVKLRAWKVLFVIKKECFLCEHNMNR